MLRSLSLLVSLSCLLNWSLAQTVPCTNVEKSTNCNAFMTSPKRVPLNMSMLVQEWYRDPQVWPTVFGDSRNIAITRGAEFDAIFERYILKYEGEKYKSDMPNLNCDLSQEPIRYYKSNACAFLFLYGEQICSGTNTPWKPFNGCASTSKTHYGDIRQAIGTKSNTCNQTWIPALEAIQKEISDNVPDSNCVNGDTNEPGLCGYDSKELACARKCAASGLDCTGLSSSADPNSASSNNGLHPAIIVAIVIGIAGCIAFSVFIYRREQRNKEETMNPSLSSTPSSSGQSQDRPTSMMSVMSAAPNLPSPALGTSSPSIYQPPPVNFSNNPNTSRPLSHSLPSHSSPISLQTIMAQSQLHSRPSSVAVPPQYQLQHQPSTMSMRPHSIALPSPQNMLQQSNIPVQQQQFTSQPQSTFQNLPTAISVPMSSPPFNPQNFAPSPLSPQSLPVSNPQQSPVLHPQSNWPLTTQNQPYIPEYMNSPSSVPSSPLKQPQSIPVPSSPPTVQPSELATSVYTSPVAAPALSSNQYESPLPQPPTSPEQSNTQKANLSYTPQLSDELLVTPGDPIAIETAYEDGWAMGTNLMTGGRGVFPMSVFKTVEESYTAAGGNAQYSEASRDVVMDSEGDNGYLGATWEARSASLNRSPQK
ncbi:hypothetical protein BKA69DRAFT_265932 [Paraphysoderma sedebokerense]|nr:hypothetical protein BKA69DRAFT_265932 [Paraphysoderma sedebokerense]